MIWIEDIMLKFMTKLNKIINNEKDKQVFKNILGALVIKGGALLISLLTMPAYIRYFDDEVILGLWFTVLSVMSWILSFDFGIGNGLRNKLVESIEKKDKKEIKEYISSAYVIIGGIVIIVTFLGIIIFKYLDWNSVFNIPKNVVSEETMLFTIRCVFIGIMLQFFFRLISSVLYALQKSSLNNLMSLITSILQLIFVLLYPSFDIESNLKVLSFAYILCVNIPLIIVSLIVFKKELINCSPNIRYFNRFKARGVLSLGGIFFWNQLMYMLITVTNEFFISRYSGPEFVVEYQVYNKLFTIIGSLFMLALTPMWSAITKALNEKDSKWVSKVYKRLNQLSIIMVFFEFMLIIFLQFIINIWLGDKAIDVNYLYAVVFALFGSIFIYQSVLSTIVCGMGTLKLQAICYTLGAVLKFVIIFYGINFFNSWIIVIIANAIILLPYCILQPGFIKKELNKINNGGILNV